MIVKTISSVASLGDRSFWLDPNSDGKTLELESLLNDHKADGNRPRKGQRMNGQDRILGKKRKFLYYGNKTLRRKRRKRGNTIFTFGHTVDFTS